MMISKRLMVLFGLIPLLFMVPMTSATVEDSLETQQTGLTIYTYDSLLADPGYAFDRAFEEHAGLPNNSVEVVLLEDAGSIVTKATSEKEDPVADVLIGIDNVLVSQARDQDILTPYQPEGVDNLIPGLVGGLASDYLLTPYDFGTIALYYLNSAFDADIDTDNLDLESLMQEDVKNQLIVENPQLSSPGLGFLLSTIAMYGDDAGVEGLIDGDWENFWRQLSEGTKMTGSWGDAFSVLYSKEANRSMMVSYSTSPAYDTCVYDSPTTTAILPTVDGTQYGWNQIEGIGLVKNADNPELAKQFIDWFISEELQSQIHLNQWMYPARDNIPTPDCYDAAIDPSTITPLNDRISQDVLSNNLDSWLSTWEVAWTEGTNTSQIVPTPVEPYFLLGILALVPIISKRRRS